MGLGSKLKKAAKRGVSATKSSAARTARVAGRNISAPTDTGSIRRGVSGVARSVRKADRRIFGGRGLRSNLSKLSKELRKSRGKSSPSIATRTGIAKKAYETRPGKLRRKQ